MVSPVVVIFGKELAQLLCVESAQNVHCVLCLQVPHCATNTDSPFGNVLLAGVLGYVVDVVDLANGRISFFTGTDNCWFLDPDCEISGWKLICHFYIYHSKDTSHQPLISAILQPKSCTLKLRN